MNAMLTYVFKQSGVTHQNISFPYCEVRIRNIVEHLQKNKYYSKLKNKAFT